MPLSNMKTAGARRGIAAFDLAHCLVPWTAK
jgi:hypothetical protein